MAKNRLHTITAADIRDATFGKPPIGQQGYRHEDVDNFLRMIAERLDAGQLVSPKEVHAITFRRPPMFQRGYNAVEVDEFLDRLALAAQQELTRRERDSH
ncbi:DivIVA domain-containing protein [Mycolicibacterium sp. BK634]|uniref:DivIVA domain-containing protein n=1 Tax=Mycolicibacterium sp. BK634 TaxID=2587099 RepID=UPI00161A60FE|nr:DivIVA domain-containing protein [Mycolicibacterium sp. BK634]